MEELKQDLLSVRRIVSDEKISEIAYNALINASKAVIETKIRSIFDFVKFVLVNSVKLTSYLIKTLKEEKLKAPKKWIIDSKNQIINKVEQIKKIWQSMTPQQRADTIIDFSIMMLFAFLVSGGFDLEGGLPDKDLTFGVRNHRNIFTHTILLGLTMEFIIRFLAALVIESEKLGYVPKSKILQSLLNFVKKHHTAAISGMWLGLFLHFLKDSNYFSARTKPYVGIRNMTMRDHQNVLISNAMAAAIFSQPKEQLIKHTSQDTNE